jgi:hypothetical protein
VGSSLNLKPSVNEELEFCYAHLSILCHFLSILTFNYLSHIPSFYTFDDSSLFIHSPPNATTCPYRLRGLPPGCGRSITDFWGWDDHRARSPCPDDVSDDDMYKRGVPGGALNLSSTSYADHGRRGDVPLQGKIPTVEPGNQHGTSWLVVRISDQQATRLVLFIHVYTLIFFIAYQD